MSQNELYHHGIKGMRWGLRRYQNEDGSLTAAGEKRYYGKANAIQKDIDSFKPIRGGLKTKKGKQLLTEDDVSGMVKGLETQRNAARAKGDARRERDRQKLERREQIKNSDTLKKFAKGAAITAGVALAAYGGYKVAKMHPDAINKAKSAVSKIFSDARNARTNKIRKQLEREAGPKPKNLKNIANTTSRMNFNADTGRKERKMSAKEFRDFDKKMLSDEPFKIGSGNSSGSRPKKATSSSNKQSSSTPKKKKTTNKSSKKSSTNINDKQFREFNRMMLSDEPFKL